MSASLTRRHLLYGAAAASAGGLLLPRPARALGPAMDPATAQTVLALELGGSIAGVLKTARAPNQSFEGGDLRLGEFEASFMVGGSSALVEWALSIARGEGAVKSGAVIVAEYDLDVRRRIEFDGGVVTGMALPRLVASEAKKQFAIGLKWQPQQVDHLAGSGKLGGGAGLAKQKSLMTNNYRLLGFPGESDFVVAIDLPTVTRKGGGKGKPIAEISPLSIEFAGRSQDSVYKFVRKVMDDGKLSGGERLDLQVQILDANGNEVMATVSLGGCGLRSYGEGEITANADAAPTLKLAFDVDSVDLRF